MSDEQGRQGRQDRTDDAELVRLMTSYQAGELAAFERLYARLAGELRPLLFGGGGEGDGGGRPGTGHLPRDPPLAPHLPAAAAGAPLGVRHRAQRPRPPPAGGVAAGAARGGVCGVGSAGAGRGRAVASRASSATSRRRWRASPPRGARRGCCTTSTAGASSRSPTASASVRGPPSCAPAGRCGPCARRWASRRRKLRDEGRERWLIEPLPPRSPPRCSPRWRAACGRCARWPRRRGGCWPSCRSGWRSSSPCRRSGGGAATSPAWARGSPGGSPSCRRSPGC